MIGTKPVPIIGMHGAKTRLLSKVERQLLITFIIHDSIGGASINMGEKQRDEFQKAFKSAFPHTIPVLTGFLILGMAYGVLMHTKGYGILWAVLMSAIAFCGSMQFVAITLLTTAFNPVQAFLLSIMINARHLFYGISMLEKYKGLGKVRVFLIYVLCDETFSISSSINPPDNINRKYFYLTISALNYSYWVLGTFLGGTLGNFITFNTKGLDFVLTALFSVLFLEQMKKKENRISGILGVICTVLGLAVFGADNVVIPSMILVFMILILGRKRLCY
jgi:4-azaleucine resistance transporter AzlC